MIDRVSSGSRVWDSTVKSTRSANRTVTSLRCSPVSRPTSASRCSRSGARAVSTTSSPRAGSLCLERRDGALDRFEVVHSSASQPSADPAGYGVDPRRLVMLSGGRARSEVAVRIRRAWPSPEPTLGPSGRVPGRRRTATRASSLANERTFLAWIRTSLALIAGGLAIGRLPARRSTCPAAARLLGPAPGRVRRRRRPGLAAQAGAATSRPYVPGSRCCTTVSPPSLAAGVALAGRAVADPPRLSAAGPADTTGSPASASSSIISCGVAHGLVADRVAEHDVDGLGRVDQPLDPRHPLPENALGVRVVAGRRLARHARAGPDLARGGGRRPARATSPRRAGVPSHDRRGRCRRRRAGCGWSRRSRRSRRWRRSSYHVWLRSSTQILSGAARSAHSTM